MTHAITDPVTTLSGVGPKKAAALAALGIETVEDLLRYYPRDYEDRRRLTPIAQVVPGETSLIRARILLLIPHGYRTRTALEVLAEDETGRMRMVFFNAPYLTKTFSKEKTYDFYGRVQDNNGVLEMIHPEWSEASSDQEGPGILPVYPLTEGVSQKDLRKYVREALPYVQLLPESLPEPICREENLCELAYAVSEVHYPTDGKRLREARYRLVFEELFLLQTALARIRQTNRQERNGIAFDRAARCSDFCETLPFTMTEAQLAALGEIERDMETAKPMNRLLQGDVGSGKTAVAAAACFKAVKSGFQAVFMAPTEILAKQHFATLKKQFLPFDVRTALLTGSTGKGERQEILRGLQEGSVDLLIGTHAVLEEAVSFAKLGLVVTDEQHRFGVAQRTQLTEKGASPDVLVMTATPIPRTLAAILYGDLDVSVIDTLPPGRKPIQTTAVSEKKREQAYAFLKSQCDLGRQGYVIAPLIEESEAIDAHAAVSLFEEMRTLLPGIRTALLHGEMKQAEKDAVMEQFLHGEIQVLVSTVVIEVGIDVPNATVMVIENAERFGLAQMHQLRGRVGRGSEQSYCILLHEHPSAISQERVRMLCETTDGFALAEKDLELRGPGEFFGLRQHGLPEFRLADLSKHRTVLERVRAASGALLADDPRLQKPENRAFAEALHHYLNEVWDPGR